MTVAGRQRCDVRIPGGAPALLPPHSLSSSPSTPSARQRQQQPPPSIVLDKATQDTAPSNVLHSSPATSAWLLQSNRSFDPLIDTSLTASLLMLCAPPPPPPPSWGGWECHDFATPIAVFTKWVLPTPSGPERGRSGAAAASAAADRYCRRRQPPLMASLGRTAPIAAIGPGAWGGMAAQLPPPPALLSTGAWERTSLPPLLMAIGLLVRRCRWWRAFGAGG